MSCNASPLCRESGSIQEFPFDGVYAGLASPRQKDEQNLKRQPKRRRGLWHACFAQPHADEPPASSASRSAPSRLTLTGDTLAFRRTGSPETRHVPLSSIRDIQHKWIEAGGARVSKVTITVDSGKEPVIIRGLKNPQDLLEALKRRQQAAANQLNDGQPHERDAGRPAASSAPGAGTPGGRWSEGCASPVKHMTPRELFADATGSPVSGANSGGGMTLLSAFARSPAQDFAGADSVAREIQLASPGREEDSYTSRSSLESETAEPPGPCSTAAAAPLGAGQPPGHGSVQGTARRTADPPPPPPPHQPSDSFALPAAVSLSSMVQSPAPQQRHAADAAGCGGGRAPPPEELLAGVLLMQQSPRGPPRPAPRTAGGSPPLPAEDSVMGGSSTQLTPESSPPVLRRLAGGSPPPRAEDSAPASVQGSPQALRAQPYPAEGMTPPPAEDSAAHRNPSVPLRTASSSGNTRDVGVPDMARATSLPPIHAAQRAGNGEDLMPRSVSDMPVHLSEASFSSRAPGAVETRRGAAELPVDLPLPAAAAQGSGSAANTPRFAAHVAKQQQQRVPHEAGHRVTQGRLAGGTAGAGAGAAAAARDSSPDAARGPAWRSEGGGSVFESASSGELADSPGASSSRGSASPQKPPVLAGAGGSEREEATAAGGGTLHGALGSGAKGPVGTLGIAAAAATVSAVLTSAASAGLGSVGLAAAPSLTGSATVAAAGSAGVAVAVAPLTLMGLTVAAAVTLVAAAAVTHIRTGSPLRPLEAPYNLELQATLDNPPLLRAAPRGGEEEVVESPVCWSGGRHRSASLEGGGRATPCGVPVTGRKSADAAAAAASAARSPRQPAGQGGSGGLREEEEEEEKLAPAPLLVGRATGPGAASEAVLEVERSWCNSSDVTGTSPATELSLAEGRSGAVPGSRGDGSEDAATSGAWGSHRTLAEDEAEQGAEATSPFAAAAGRSAQAQGRASGSGGGAAAAADANPVQVQQHHQHHSDGEEEPLPVMLFAGPSAGDFHARTSIGGDAPLGAVPDAHAAWGAGRSSGAVGDAAASSASAACAGVSGAAGAEAPAQVREQPAAGVAHAGELHAAALPPPSQARAAVAETEPDLARTVTVACVGAAPVVAHPHSAKERELGSRQSTKRDPTVRQLFGDFEAESSGAARAYRESTHLPQQQQQQRSHLPQGEEAQEPAETEYAANVPVLRAAPRDTAQVAGEALPAVGGLAAVAASPSSAAATRRRRTQHLTESPVRVLYSVHASFTGLPAADPRVSSPQALSAPQPDRCESAVQTDAPKAECAVQTEATSSRRTSTASSRPTVASGEQLGHDASGSRALSDASGDAPGSRAPVDDPAAEVPQVPLAASVAAGVIAGSHRCSSSSGSNSRRRSSGVGSSRSLDSGDSSSSGGVLHPLAASAVQEVFTLESPQDSSQQGGSPKGGMAAVEQDGGDGSRGSRVSARDGSGPPSSVGSPSPRQAGAQDWYMSSVGLDSQLGAAGFELAAPTREQAREEASPSLSTAGSSALSPFPSTQGASPPSVAAAGAEAPLLLAGLPSCSRASTSGSSPRTASRAAPDAGDDAAEPARNEEETPLLGCGGRSSDCGVVAEGEPQGPSAWARSAAPPDPAEDAETVNPGRRRADAVRLISAERGSSASRGGSSSSRESSALSPSASGSSPLSASVGSGLYTPLASEASSGGHAVGVADAGSDHTLTGETPSGAADPAGVHAVGVPDLARSESTSPRGSGSGDSVLGGSIARKASPAASVSGDSAREGAGGKGLQQADSEQRLLSPEVPLSAEPPARWPRLGTALTATSAGASSASVNSAQDGSPHVDGRVGSRARGAPETSISTAAAEASSRRLTLGSDTADDMVWLLGAAAGHTSDEPGIDDGYAGSAPDSPRIPPPPSIASSSNHSSSCGRARRATHGALWGQAAAAEKSPSCASRVSSSGSCGANVEGSRLARRASGSRGSVGSASSGCSAWPEGNQLATPLSSGACGSAADRGPTTAHACALNSSAGSTSSSRSGTPCSSCADRGFGAGAPGGAPLADVGGAVDSPPALAPVSSSLASSPSLLLQQSEGAASRVVTPVSPDLSDISSPGYGGGAYVYGSPGDRDVAGGPRVEPGGVGASAVATGAAAAAGTDDDLFHNPLYTTPRQAPADKAAAPGSQLQRNGSGTIALSLVQYSEGQSYGGMDGNGTGTSTCTSSPEVASALQPTPQSVEVSAVGAGRRRTREEAAATSSYRYDDGGLQSLAAGAVHGGASGREGPAVDANGAGNVNAGSGGGSADSPSVPPKRARMQHPQPTPLPEASSAQQDLPQEQRQQQTDRQPSTPAQHQGRGLPLVSPLMVLNPTYAQSAASQSAGASPAVTSPPQGPHEGCSSARGGASPDAAQQSDTLQDTATPCPGNAAAVNYVTAKAVGVAAEAPQAATDARKDEFRDVKDAYTGAEGLHTPLRVSPRHALEHEWAGVQGSPSSQQATHAAVLLRHANDAVDDARDAVQRGDARWLARVTATLQAVQSALDALREF